MMVDCPQENEMSAVLLCYKCFFLLMVNRSASLRSNIVDVLAFTCSASPPVTMVKYMNEEMILHRPHLFIVTIEMRANHDFILLMVYSAVK